MLVRPVIPNSEEDEDLGPLVTKRPGSSRSVSKRIHSVSDSFSRPEQIEKIAKNSLAVRGASGSGSKRKLIVSPRGHQRARTEVVPPSYHNSGEVVNADTSPETPIPSLTSPHHSPRNSPKHSPHQSHRHPNHSPSPPPPSGLASPFASAPPPRPSSSLPPRSVDPRRGGRSGTAGSRIIAKDIPDSGGKELRKPAAQPVAK